VLVKSRKHREPRVARVAGAGGWLPAHQVRASGSPGVSPGFPQFLPLQLLQLLPHVQAWMCHNGQGDVPVMFEAWLTSNTSQPRAVSSYRGRSSLRTRA
jgi:hypothetical protein